MNIGYRSRAHIRTVREEAWLADAACNSAAVKQAAALVSVMTGRRLSILNDIMFPERPGNASKPEIYDTARSVCATCPVRVACLEFANREQIEEGVFGGLTPTERLLADEGLVHGTRNLYEKHGCRCPDCQRAGAEYKRLQSRRRLAAREVKVPVEQFMEEIDSAVVDLLHGQSRLVGRLLGVALRPHLVPVDVHPDVPVAVHHARAVSQ